MPLEIERRFLVIDDEWRAQAGRSERYRQGYLARTPEATVRVRRADDWATLTVKGPRSGVVRAEFESPLALEDADAMLRDLCPKPLIQKTRHWVEHRGLTWHVDVYAGRAAGLVLAEIELADPRQAFPHPPWLGDEVTHDLRYRSAALALGRPKAAARALDPEPMVALVAEAAP